MQFTLVTTIGNGKLQAISSGNHPSLSLFITNVRTIEFLSLCHFPDNCLHDFAHWLPLFGKYES